MSSTSENYLFLGLPKSGKTTYFVQMAQHLQDAANRSRKKLSFRYLSTLENGGDEEEITQKFIDDGIDQLRKQKWPQKTQGYEQGYSCELTVCPSPSISRSTIIDYHDYPGEAYEAAFGIGDDPSPKMREVAKGLRDRISTARGIFLLIDTDAVFNGKDDQKAREILTKLFRYIQKSNPTLKLAVIFNKLELFYGKKTDFEKCFRKKYSNAYAYLPSNFRFFKVYPLGEVETAEDGSVIPPRKLHPIDILEPVRWMFDEISRIEDIKEIFSEKDIASYHNMNSLRKAFREKWNEIEETIDGINSLIKEYPQNPDLKRKLERYEKYRQSMLATSFPCPEHISSGTCDACKGTGKRWWGLGTCKKCKGKGTVDKNCPNCGKIYRSSIYGRDLR